MHKDLSILTASFLELTELLPPLPDEFFTTAFESYSEHWRTYHNVGHICSMLRTARVVASNDNLTRFERNALGLGILGHDIVYKLGRDVGWNENQSATLMLDVMTKAGMSHDLRMTVWSSIVATISHQVDDLAAEHRRVASYLCDLDLMGLGNSSEQFDATTEAIWREYEPVATREEFDKGRSEWARTFLFRDRIYKTCYFRLRESQAKRNLRRLASTPAHGLSPRWIQEAVDTDMF